MSARPQTPWIGRYAGNVPKKDNPSVRLFCFSHAGGNYNGLFEKFLFWVFNANNSRFQKVGDLVRYFHTSVRN